MVAVAGCSGHYVSKNNIIMNNENKNKSVEKN